MTWLTRLAALAWLTIFTLLPRLAVAEHARRVDLVVVEGAIAVFVDADRDEGATARALRVGGVFDDSDEGGSACGTNGSRLTGRPGIAGGPGIAGLTLGAALTGFTWGTLFALGAAAGDAAEQGGQDYEMGDDGE